MGSGIAQVAAAAGHPVVLGDVSEPALEKARAGIARVMAREVEKGRKSAAEAEAVTARLEIAPTGEGYRAFAGCGVIIEAIAEDLAIKQQVFAALEQERAGGSPRHQHVVPLGHRHRLRLRRTRTGARRPLLQPGAGHAAGGDRRWARDRSRAALRHAGAGGRLGQAHGHRRRHARVHRQPRRAAVLQRGAPAARRGHRRPRDHRLGDEGVRRLPDGPVRADGPDRERHQLRGHPLGVRRVRLRAALPAVAAAAPHGGGEARWAGRPAAAGTTTARARRPRSRTGTRSAAAASWGGWW